MDMGWSMNELYRELYASSIRGCNNFGEKILVWLIKIAQKYTVHLEISKYTGKICINGKKNIRHMRKYADDYAVTENS